MPLLLGLEKTITQALDKPGIQTRQHPYVPHITVGRVRNHRARSTLARMAHGLPRQYISPVVVNKLILFESTLNQEGAVYTRFASFPLTG